MPHLDYPYHFDSRSRTAEASQPDYLRDLIEQVLFTSPGERVNRPDFGCGLAQLVFAPNSEELAATTQYLVQSALQRWLGNLIQVEALNVQGEEAALTVMLSYRVQRTGEQRTATFTRGGNAA
ncbi:MAG: hypothetical protein E1N59_2035 [Puniceicoccaceae bacterium 5H]|nr:MAG: hypothetical protein E1N59_2035 [Puniceicoccaceae bacterium 5H]